MFRRALLIIIVLIGIMGIVSIATSGRGPCIASHQEPAKTALDIKLHREATGTITVCDP